MGLLTLVDRQSLKIKNPETHAHEIRGKVDAAKSVVNKFAYGSTSGYPRTDAF